MAALYYIEIDDGYGQTKLYKITDEYLRGKLLNLQDVTIEEDNIANPEEDLESAAFLKKIVPSFSIETITIKASYVNELIESSMQDNYLEEFESMIVFQRTHWLAIIFLFYCERIDLNFIMRLIEQQEIETRSKMLIEKLAPTDNDFIDVFESMNTFMRSKFSSVAPMKFSYFMGAENMNKIKTSIDDYDNISSRVSFPSYYVYESVFTMYKYSNSMSLSWAWENINRSRNPQVCTWDENVLNFWDKLWGNLKAIFSLNLVRVVKIFIAGINFYTLIACMKNPHKKQMNQKRRSFKMRDFIRFMVSKNYIPVIYRDYFLKEFFSGARESSNYDTMYKEADGFMWSVDNVYSGTFDTETDEVGDSFVDGKRNRFLQKSAGIPSQFAAQFTLPTKKYGIDAASYYAPSTYGTFAASMSEKLFGSAENSISNIINGVPNQLTVTDNKIDQFKNIKDFPVLIKGLSNLSRSSSKYIVKKNNTYIDYNRFTDDLKKRCKNHNLSNLNYQFTVNKILMSNSVAEERAKYIEMLEGILAEFLKDYQVDGQYENLGEAMYATIVADCLEEFIKYIDNDNVTTINNRLLLNEETLCYYRLGRMFYFMMCKNTNFISSVKNQYNQLNEALDAIASTLCKSGSIRDLTTWWGY